MLANGTVTLYQMDTTGGYTRLVINNVFIRDVEGSNISRTGNRDADTMTVLLWKKSVIAATGSSTQMVFSKGKDLAVRGVCDYTPDNSTPEAKSASNKAIRALGAVTVMSVEYNLYGSDEMQHYLLSCK